LIYIHFAKAYGIYGRLWQSSSRRIKLCQSLRSLWVSFGKVHRVESNFAKAWEVYRSALAKFFPANQTLPKLAKFMGQLWQRFFQANQTLPKLAKFMGQLWQSLSR